MNSRVRTIIQNSRGSHVFGANLKARITGKLGALGAAWALAWGGLAHGQGLTPLWTRPPGSHPGLPASGTLYRVLDYNPVTGHVLFCSRAVGANGIIYTLDGLTGGDLGQMDMTGVSGGTIPLNAIGVADDGAVYGANVVSPISASNPLKVYRWENEGAPPVLIYAGDLGGLTSGRYGDMLTVRGAGPNTQVLISSDQAAVVMLTPGGGGGGGAWVAQRLPIVGGTANFYNTGLTFLAGDEFYGKRSGNAMHRVGFDLGAGTAQFLNSIPTTVVPAIVVGINFDPASRLLGGVTRNTTTPSTHTAYVWDAANPAAPVTLASANLPTTNGDGGAAQSSAAWGAGRLYVMVCNNGIVAYCVAPWIRTPPQDVTANEGEPVIFSVEAHGTPPLHYEWYRNGDLIPGVPGPILSLPGVTCADHGALFTVKVSNGCGEVTSQAAVLTVRDNVPPTLTCPPDQTAQATGPGGAIVYYPPPTVVDPCDPNPLVVCLPESGSVFPVGSTPVLCTATDRGGLQGTCSFNVVVQPPPQPKKKYFFKEPLLPPLTGQYVAPAAWYASFPSGILVSNMAHRLFTAAVSPPDPAGPPVIHSCGATVEVETSLDGGLTWTPFVGHAGMTLRLEHLGFQGGAQLVEVEVLQLTLAGPGGLMIRENPSQPSTGRTTLQPVSGGYMIDSFFDIFIEISTDEGGTWQPASGPARMELEVDPQSVPPMLSLLNLNPPPMAEYVAREEVWQAYPNGVIIRNAKKKLFSPCIELPPFGQRASNVFEAQMDCQLSTDGGLTWQAVRAPVQGWLVVEHSRDFAGRATLTRELAMRMAGGDLPPGLMIRESPTLPSRGGASVIAEPEGYRVSSFFDIFTEVSTDGGLVWQPASSGPARMVAEPAAAIHRFPDPLLPPPTGEYVSPAQWQADFANGIVLRNLIQKRFTQSIPPPLPGPPVTHSCGSIVEMEVSTDGGQTFSSMSAPADVTISIRHAGTDGQANYYDTEITQLDIRGGDLPPGLRVRESPTRPSTGRTSQGAIGMENDCDSFFDIFLEVSTDGGLVWQPAKGAPATMMLRPGVGPQPLIITCPDDITVTATSPAGTAVGWTNIVMGGTPPIQVNCVPANGSTFAIGVTPVTCTATDAGGQTASCSFRVKVLPQRRFFRAKLLPPPDGMYVSPAAWHAQYGNGMVVSNVLHKAFPEGLEPPPPGGEVTHSFESVVQLELAAAEGAPWQAHTAPATATVRIRHLPHPGWEEIYETELLALNIQGGTLPPSVRFRVSPHVPSLGETRILPITGGHRISSFFDIFTEISTDGGASWSPSSVAGKVELTHDPTRVPPAEVPTPLLPPLVHHYVLPAGGHVAFANGVVITEMRQALFAGAVLPPPFGSSAVHTFDSQVDMVVQTGLGAPMHVRAPAVMTVGVLHTKDFLETQYLEAEALALTIAGGDLPPGFRLRESPTLASHGGISLEGGGGGGGNIRASSFFDIFVELSPDGGTSWWPATSGPVRVQLETLAPEATFPTPELPPLDGEYASLPQRSAFYPQGILIRNLIHRRFSRTFPPPSPGGQETLSFAAEVQMDVSDDGGLTWRRWVAPATCTVRIASLQDQGDTRYFDTEMLWLDIAGGDLPPGMRLRESPTKASPGRVSERSLMIEQFGISSFFDVFTELSVDDGRTWQPSQTGPTTIILRRSSCEPPVVLEHPQDSTAECGSNAVFSVRATGTPPLSYQWRADGVPLPSIIPHGPVLVFGPCTLGDDGKLFDVVVSNACGAVTSRVAVLRVVDTIPPEIVCPPGMVMPTELGECCARVVYPLPAARDGCSGVTVSCEPPPGFCFPLGTTQVNCTARDDSGNQATCEFPITVVDAEPPHITCPDAIHDQTDPGVCHKANVTWVVTASDNCPGVTVECQPPSGSTFPRGQTPVTCTATDAAGQQARCTFIVTIRDLEAPHLVCPDDLTLPTDPGECSRRHVSWTATATDNCDDVAPVCEPPSGSTFPLGSTLVTCRATDTSGNSAECSFTVTILDLERPRLICPQRLEFETDLGQCAKSNVTYQISANDNCTNVTVVCEPPEGSTFPVGTHPVSCTATDASGNTSACDFTVTVRDLELPVITACAPPTRLVADTNGTAPLPDLTGQVIAQDNCGVVSKLQMPPPGTPVPLGVHEVTFTVADEAGNAASCRSTVYVVWLPTLVIHRLGPEVAIGWTNTGGLWCLQEAEVVAPAPVPWTDVGVPPVVSNNWCWVVLPALETRFYRLRLCAGEEEARLQAALETWNSHYGAQVQAVSWTDEGLITTPARRSEVVGEMTAPDKAWFPSGDVGRPWDMTALRISDDPTVPRADVLAWQQMVNERVQLGHRVFRVHWMKGPQPFSTLCVFDGCLLVYDSMLANALVEERPIQPAAVSKTCFRGVLKGLFGDKRGEIKATGTANCKDGRVVSCDANCIAWLALGAAKINCTCVKINEWCCQLRWSWAYATGFKKIKVGADSFTLEIEGILGSSGAGNGSCTICCDEFGP